MTEDDEPIECASPPCLLSEMDFAGGGEPGRATAGNEAATTGGRDAAMQETRPPTYMEHAIEEARAAGMRGEVPVGAVLVDAASGAVIATAGNRVEERGDPTAHAEIEVIREGARRYGRPRLGACDLYVTLEPCAMCATAVSLARIRRLFFGAYDPKMGGVEHGARLFAQPTCHHAPEVVGGLDETRCAQLLKDFFRERR